MNALQSLSITLCFTAVAVSIITVMIPQKRTRRIMSYVIGLFFISTFITSAAAHLNDIDFSLPDSEEIVIPTYSETDYQDTVAQMTADNLAESLDELLENEGVKADDIQLALKISDEGRISVVRAVIYISETDRPKTAQIKSIVYRNISKEPEIYVSGEEAQPSAE